jgi:hypothetical protein
MSERVLAFAGVFVALLSVFFPLVNPARRRALRGSRPSHSPAAAPPAALVRCLFKLKTLLLEPGSMVAQVPQDVLIPIPAAALEKIIRVVSHSHRESRKLAFALSFRFWKPPPLRQDGSKRSFFLHVLFVHPRRARRHALAATARFVWARFGAAERF